MKVYKKLLMKAIVLFVVEIIILLYFIENKTLMSKLVKNITNEVIFSMFQI